MAVFTLCRRYPSMTYNEEHLWFFMNYLHYSQYHFSNMWWHIDMQVHLYWEVPDGHPHHGQMAVLNMLHTKSWHVTILCSVLPLETGLFWYVDLNTRFCQKNLPFTYKFFNYDIFCASSKYFKREIILVFLVTTKEVFKTLLKCHLFTKGVYWVTSTHKETKWWCRLYTSFVTTAPMTQASKIRP